MCTRLSTARRLPALAIVLLGATGGCDPSESHLDMAVEAWSEESSSDYPLNVELMPATVFAVESPGSIGWDGQGWRYTLGPGHPADPGHPPVTLEIDLPGSFHPDLAPGDRVWLTVEQDPDPWMGSTLVEVRSLGGDLLLYYYEGHPRWSNVFLEAYHTEWNACGLWGHPQVTYIIDGPGLDPAVEVTLRQGQIKKVDTAAGRYAVMLASASLLLQNRCNDASDYEEVAILRMPPP